jgi:putative ABC transport system substrate-binding protein
VKKCGAPRTAHRAKKNGQTLRRKNASVFALCALLHTLGLPVWAQEVTKVPRIGYLRFVEVPVFDSAFRKGLSELGYIEGQNIQVEYRYAGGSGERLAELAAELVNLRVDVIVAGSTQSIDAAKRLTKTIPIVFPVTFDPVASGFVASLARPGGNLTGLSTVNPDAAVKRVELLKEIMPRLSRVAVLRNPTNSGSALVLKETEAGAKHLGLRLQSLEAQSRDQLEGAFRLAIKEKAGAMIVIVDALYFSERKGIANLGMKYRLPGMFDDRQYAEAGGLISYGANLSDLFRRAAVYVDKILKGTKPAELPVEQPTKFELVINLKAAKQIGLTIPPNVLARADRVIR